MRTKNADGGAVAAERRPTTDVSPGPPEPLTALHRYEGLQVSIALGDGTTLSDCVLVSAGRGRVDTLWILTEDADRFIRRADVAQIWLAAADPRSQAA